MQQSRIPPVVTTIAVALTVAIAAVVVAVVVGVMNRPGSGFTTRPGASEQPNLSAGGITAQAATDLARSHVGADAVLVSSKAGRYIDVFIHGEEPGAVDTPDRLVWAVEFDEQFTICPPNGDPCWSPRPGRTQVILDYFTGEFLESASIAPA